MPDLGWSHKITLKLTYYKKFSLFIKNIDKSVIVRLYLVLVLSNPFI